MRVLSHKIQTHTFILSVFTAIAMLCNDASSAPAPEARPVIVIFDENVSLDGFEDLYRPDDRSRANPEAWGYLNRGVAGTVARFENRLGFRANHLYSRAIRGFSAHLTPRQIQALQNDLLVSYVEPDTVATTTAQALPWGVDRIDADQSFTLAGNGSGVISNVRAYVIDSGIAAHSDLNLVQHINFAGGKNTDCNGHGTHVAGTIAAKDNSSDVVGVAPSAALIGVKVLSCGGWGWMSDIIKGVDWVTANAAKPAVANMSLGGGINQSLDTAILNSARSGVFYSVAAGNEGADACASSPARMGAYDGIMAVAATDKTDAEASWSNFGDCVDLWAPGVSIVSTRKGGGTTTMSGTSMAAPHAAGAAALYLSQNPGATAAQVEAALQTAASPTTKTSKDGAPISLIYVGGLD